MLTLYLENSSRFHTIFYNTFFFSIVKKLVSPTAKSLRKINAPGRWSYTQQLLEALAHCSILLGAGGPQSKRVPSELASFHSFIPNPITEYTYPSSRTSLASSFSQQRDYVTIKWIFFFLSKTPKSNSSRDGTIIHHPTSIHHCSHGATGPAGRHPKFMEWSYRKGLDYSLHVINVNPFSL